MINDIEKTKLVDIEAQNNNNNNNYYDDYRVPDDLRVIECIVYSFLFCAYYILLANICDSLFVVRTEKDILVLNLIICGVMGAIVSMFKVIALYWWSLRDNTTTPSCALNTLTRFISVYFMLYAIFSSLIILQFSVIILWKHAVATRTVYATLA